MAGATSIDLADDCVGMVAPDTLPAQTLMFSRESHGVLVLCSCAQVTLVLDIDKMNGGAT